MFIDADKPDTFPVEIESAVVQYIMTLPQDIVKKISNYKIQYDIDVRCFVEDYMAPFNIRTEILYADVLRIMEEYDLVCFHATKLLSRKEVYVAGLRTNDWKRYSDMMKKTFDKVGLLSDSINEAMGFLKHEYEYKYFDKDRNAQLCFYSNLSLTSKGETAGYDQFCENIGGELARRALRDNMPQVFQLLKKNGEAVIIKFLLPFFDVAYYNKDTIAYQFICRSAAKYFWNYDYTVNFDGDTIFDVPPENILEVIPYTEEVNYS